MFDLRCEGLWASPVAVPHRDVSCELQPVITLSTFIEVKHPEKSCRKVSIMLASFSSSAETYAGSAAGELLPSGPMRRVTNGENPRRPSCSGVEGLKCEVDVRLLSRKSSWTLSSSSSANSVPPMVKSVRGVQRGPEVTVPPRGVSGEARRDVTVLFVWGWRLLGSCRASG